MWYVQVNVWDVQVNMYHDVQVYVQVICGIMYVQVNMCNMYVQVNM